MLDAFGRVVYEGFYLYVLCFVANVQSSTSTSPVGTVKYFIVYDHPLGSTLYYQDLPDQRRVEMNVSGLMAVFLRLSGSPGIIR